MKYSVQLIREIFGQVDRHRQAGEIIRTYSTNKNDIYRLALDEVKFNRQVTILDIGCGYGSVLKYLKDSVASGSKCTGIDIVRKNQKPYLADIAASGLEGEFICAPAEVISDMSDNSYQLIISCYSLNFFADMLPEIARLLSPDGIFIAITHSSTFLREITSDINKELSRLGKTMNKRVDFREVVNSFNGEDGKRILEPLFADVKKNKYLNTLFFPEDEIDRCIEYVDFKLPILLRASDFGSDSEYINFIDSLHGRIRQTASRNHFYTVNKNDCLFQCRQPN